jgi:hypothetical protein
MFFKNIRIFSAKQVNFTMSSTLLLEPPKSTMCASLNPKNLCVALYGKRAFADVIKLKILRWGHKP